MRKIKTRDLIAVFLRSFFIQAVWNFKSLTAIGWCFALIPIGKRLFPSREQYRAFLERHLSFFNAHPYFTSYALGIAAHLEENEIQKDSHDPEKIDKIKNALIGPLGLIGDQLFWATIRPAAILIGFSGLVIMESMFYKLLFIPLMLFMYNIPHIYIRWQGVFKGYRHGPNIIRQINIGQFSRLMAIYGGLGSLALGLAIGYVMMRSSMNNVTEIPILLISIIVAYYLRSKKKLTYSPVFLSLIIALVLGIVI